ncbi:MAG: CinA family protein [Spirochaetota bacterium]
MGSAPGVPDDEALQLAESLVRKAGACGATIATAESCTGGLVAAAITAVPGSSQVFWGAYVTYANEAKRSMLGVRDETLASYGAVSEQTVIEMARGAVERSGAQHAVAISGVAGPSGGTPEKPVGTVWLGWCSRAGRTGATRKRYEGDRTAIRRASVVDALRLILGRLESG